MNNFFIHLLILLLLFIFLIKTAKYKLPFNNKHFWRIKREWRDGRDINSESFLSHQEIFREERWQLEPSNLNKNNQIMLNKQRLFNGIPVHQYNQQKLKKYNNNNIKGYSKMNAAGFFYISADFPTFNEKEEYNNKQKYTNKLNDLQNDDCSMFPNGTLNTPYAFTCSDPENGPPLFVVHDTALANSSGHYEYPLELNDISPILKIFLDLTSYSTKSYENIRAEIALLKRKVGWSGCGWINIPTFGAFDIVNICKNNDGCPIFPGRQVLEMELEPAHVFLAMLRLMLRDHKPPYELRLRLVNNNNIGEELLCVAFQTRLIF